MLVYWLALGTVWVVLFLGVATAFPSGSGRYGRAWMRWYKRSTYVNLTGWTLIMAVELSNHDALIARLVSEQRGIETYGMRVINSHVREAESAMRMAQQRMEEASRALSHAESRLNREAVRKHLP